MYFTYFTYQVTKKLICLNEERIMEAKQNEFLITFFFKSLPPFVVRLAALAYRTG